MGGNLGGKAGDFGIACGQFAFKAGVFVRLLQGGFAFCLLLGLGESFAHFGLEFAVADLVSDVGIACFVYAECGVAAGASDFVHFAVSCMVGRGGIV